MTTVPPLETSRRSFLKTLGVGAMPFVLPSHIWAAATPPNDRLTMGFIGMGKQNGGLLGNFLWQDVQVLAVCDVDTTRREAARDKVNTFYADHPDKGAGGCDAYNDFRELLARPDIDAVCIATPDHWHAIITLAALRSGKDVYCEKPLTHNIHEAIEVMRAVDANQRVLQTGSMQRSSREFRTACELVRNGVIGEVSQVYCQFGDPGIPCDLPAEELEPGLDWDLWVGPAPMRPYNSVLSPRGLHDHFPDWRDYREFGGGMVTDWGAHHLDIAQWGLGMDDSGPVAALPPSGAGDKRGASLRYADGVTVTHADGFGVRFVGDSGEVLVNRGRFKLIKDGQPFAQWTQREDGGSLGGALVKAEREFLADRTVELYRSRNHVADFLGRVADRGKPITSEQVGGRTVICCHLMNLTYYHGEKISWDPRRLAFTQGTGHPSWLTREYRGPWNV